MIGCKRDFPAQITEWRSSIPFSRFLFILSIRIIASFTTTHVNAINQIINGIEYGFPVKNKPILTQSKASITEYSTIAGCLNELNWNTNILNIKNIAMNNDLNVDIIKSSFSAFSQPAQYEIHSGKLYCSANSTNNG
jgi:hypothetical protein